MNLREHEEDDWVTLLANDFVNVRTLPPRRLFVVLRSERPARTLAEVDESWGEVERVLAFVKRADQGLLLDMREARGRNDPAFETAVASYRKRTVQGFARTAVVVRSAAGLMQVRRHIEEEGFKTVRPFDDYDQALAWLGNASRG